MQDEGPEIEFYRKVEDLFSNLRGAPHILSPRDFQLLRSWWRDDIPFAAISAGLTEVFARNRERDDADPVVSLSYCRHAVKSHARRLAQMHVGSGDGESDPDTSRDDLARLSATVADAARRHTDDRPAVAAILSQIAKQLNAAEDGLPPALLDEHLYGLESAMLAGCWDALGNAERERIEARIASMASSSTGTDDARLRAERALRDREIRLLLDLPRMELGG